MKILTDKHVLITGAAGFIGANLALKIIENCRKIIVVGIDNINDYYNTKIKEGRVQKISDACTLQTCENQWIFLKGDISNKEFVTRIFEMYHFDIVINLAAQAGVRYSIVNPDSYIQSNIIGFYNILEACRKNEIEHLIFASSSSIYGKNEKIPYSESDITDFPVSLYAATKKSNEVLAYSYTDLYGIPITGLRFFTVFGPAGRPDMAYFKFAERLAEGEKIDIFNYGNCERDFTYIDDIVEGIMCVCVEGIGDTLYEVYNLGNSTPVKLMDFVHILAEELIYAGVLEPDFDINKHINFVEMQKGDVPITFADMKKFQKRFNYAPKTSIRTGLHEFAKWFYIYKTNKKIICD